ncbi:hypothetical protein OXPF_08500 [Oxobacter pfennigii]|uniref:Uncharacterized protein n=1 Tax=Oxobacter pfennigii TaxID=36849 RepID=A0A0P8WCM7_9CLOT|nr:hypothetical protein [Oxobacter pfennigii]KPU45617.1 hypothetical protein OXPF_08500 [Oxobacter pfennigii]
MENEFLIRIKCGDKAGTKVILDKTLDYILLSGTYDLEILRTKIIEILILISRASIEYSSNLDEILEFKLFLGLCRLGPNKEEHIAYFIYYKAIIIRNLPGKFYVIIDWYLKMDKLEME